MKVLNILKDCGLTANSSKCQFYKQSIIFYGLVFSSEGVRPDPKKVLALNNSTTPTNKKELKSFLGITNFSAHFIQNYSDLTADLRKLTCEKEKWEWTSKLDESFKKLTQSLSDSCLLHYFDPRSPTELICDASPIGLGAILCQHECGKRKIIAYASRALNKTEQNYGHIEREALSILFGCLKFQHYLLGASFTIFTDHLPLVPCFNNPRSQMPYRIERMRMKLQGFDYVVKHIPGKSNISDYISRHVDSNSKGSKDKKELEEYVHAIVTTISAQAVSLHDIRKEVKKNPTLSKIIDMIMNSKNMNKNNDTNLDEFKTVFKELYVADGLLMRGSKMVIPKSLYENIITCGHEGHQGIVKTKELLRSKYWWPRMTSQIVQIIAKCIPCQASVPTCRKEPLKMSVLPNGPWEYVATDFHGPLSSGDYLLTVIDEYSRYPIVEIVKSTSYKAAIPKYDKIFSLFGIPLKVKSDNGAPFNGIEFKNFANYMGFQHQLITPEHPEANGLVEKFNSGLEKIIRTSRIESKNWRKELNSYLRNYRATPHSTTNKAAAELLFQSQTFNTRLPEVHKKISDDQLRQTDKYRKERIKEYADKRNGAKEYELAVGDCILVKIRRKQKSDPYFNPNRYTISQKKGNMITAVRGGHYITRNSSFFKRVPDSDDDFESITCTEDAEDNDESSENENPILRRSKRITAQPVPYPMDVPQ